MLRILIFFFFKFLLLGKWHIWSLRIPLLVRMQVRAASNMVEVFVDGKPVEVEPGTTVLQVWNGRNILHIPCGAFVFIVYLHFCSYIAFWLCLCSPTLRNKVRKTKTTHSKGWKVFVFISFPLSGLWEGRNPDSQILLPRAPLSGRKLPYVFGGDWKSSQGECIGLRLLFP